MKSKRQQKGAHMSEFAAVIIVFFLVILFPLINLIGIATGLGTQFLLTKESASSAANSSDYGTALMSMSNSSKSFQNMGFAKFAKLQPIGGFSNSGTDLYVIETDINSGAVRKYGPNSSVTGTVDNDRFVYEYQVKSTYNVGPFMNLANLPFIGDVDGIGKPVQFSITSEKLVEHVDGLQANVPVFFTFSQSFSVPPPPPLPNQSAPAPSTTGTP